MTHLCLVKILLKISIQLCFQDTPIKRSTMNTCTVFTCGKKKDAAPPFLLFLVCPPPFPRDRRGKGKKGSIFKHAGRVFCGLLQGKGMGERGQKRQN